MTNFNQDMRTFITASSSITADVSYNKVPEHITRPNIWYRTATNNVPLTLDGAGGIHEIFMDLECAANGEDAAQDLADQVHSKLHGYRGTAGNSSVKGMFLEDKDDDYEPVSNMSDDGVHVCAFTVHAWYTT